MPQKLRVDGPATVDELRAVRQSQKDPHDQERLIAIQMAQQNCFRITDIALALGRSTATIVRWFSKFRRGGISILLKRGHGGRKAKLQPEDIDALESGLREGKWKSAKEIEKWLSEERHLSMTLWGVHYWLKKVKASLKVPRKKHNQQDPEEVAAFKKDIVDTLSKLEIPKEKRVRVWIEDEHRYGLISTIRRCWTLRGHRPTAPVAMKYQWGYVYGAAEVTEGDSQFLYMPTVSLECSHIFLQQLVATDPQAIHIVFWDRAGFHPQMEANELKEQVYFVPLPAYSPELNPMENLWDIVKRHVSNAVWDTLEAIESAISEVLKPFFQSKERVFSLLGDCWLTPSVRIFLQQRKMLI